jgi:DNA uptake protein ComE-like DNA-binding protein
MGSRGDWRRILMKAFLAGCGVGAVIGTLFAQQNVARIRTGLATVASQGSMRRHGMETIEAELPDRIPESEAVAEVLNTAGKHELMSVPGIGRGTAKRIVEHRPYENKEEVLQEGILPEAILERIEEKLVDPGNVA